MKYGELKAKTRLKLGAFLLVCDPYGIRTRVLALRGPRPRPLDEWAVCCLNEGHYNSNTPRVKIGMYGSVAVSLTQCALDVTVGVTLGDVLTLVVVLFTACQCNLYLCPATFQIKHGRDGG